MANITGGEKSRLITHQSGVLLYEGILNQINSDLKNPHLEPETIDSLKDRKHDVINLLETEKTRLAEYEKSLKEIHDPGEVESFLKKVRELIETLREYIPKVEDIVKRIIELIKVLF